MVDDDGDDDETGRWSKAMAAPHVHPQQQELDRAQHCFLLRVPALMETTTECNSERNDESI